MIVSTKSFYLEYKYEKNLALIFAVLKFGQLSNNEQEVDDGEVRQTFGGDVYL